MDEFSTKSAPPKPTGLNKRVIFIFVTGVFLLILYVLVTGFSKREMPKPEPKGSFGTGMPTEVINSLPKDYTNWVTDKEEITVNINDATPKTVSKMNSYLEEERLRKLKRKIKARESELFVKGIQVKNTNNVKNPYLNLSDNTIQEQNTYNPRDFDNRQDEKHTFLNENRNVGTHLESHIKEKASNYELMAGSLIPGLLLTGLNSDLPGQIVGQVSKNIFDTVSGKYLLIPKGTKVIGAYDSKITYGQERILIVWTRLIYPNGDSISLKGMPGVDLSGYAGLKDKVNNHYGKLLTGVVLGSVFGASAQIARGSNRNVDPTFSQLALEGSAQNINQVGSKLTSKNLNIQPTLEVRPGYRFNVFVTKDISLRPYDGS